jgi:ankyrin repeat protein
MQALSSSCWLQGEVIDRLSYFKAGSWSYYRDHSSDAHAIDEHGKTALHAAALSGRLDLVLLLLEKYKGSGFHVVDQQCNAGYTGRTFQPVSCFQIPSIWNS